MAVPEALRIYESVRREHTARVQRLARVNGARYDSAAEDLAERDRRMAEQRQERAWIWASDPEAEVAVVLDRR